MISDYYDIQGWATSERYSDDLYLFTVNYQGTDYDECMYGYIMLDNSVNGALWTGQFRFFMRVPIGYDGLVLSIFDGNVDAKLAEDAAYINNAANENTLFFRFNK